jgi:hypothetical protein
MIKYRSLNLKHEKLAINVLMNDNKMPRDIPDNLIKSFAQCLLPAIREYFGSEEGQREYAQWKAEQEK